MSETIPPHLAEMFDLRMRIDGFSATVVHLPPRSAVLLERTPIHALALLLTALVLGYLLLCLYVAWVVPGGGIAPLLLGVVSVPTVDGLIAGAASGGRRLGDRLSRRLQRTSLLTLDAHSLQIGGERWALVDLVGMHAEGRTLVVVPRPGQGQRRRFHTRHAPWACARLCALVQEALRCRQPDPHPALPPALLHILSSAATAAAAPTLFSPEGRPSRGEGVAVVVVVVGGADGRGFKRSAGSS